mmetsp:Transcript_57227/g.66081  ORF Transcript_57227/g.66081 Transcript_57227/m.66081 type:complete len:618 (-) Transcript_57227:71-1924(-)
MSRSSNASNRHYGEIIGSIFSKSSGDLEGIQGSTTIAEAKRLFRERRQQSSPGRTLSRNSTPERRQNPSPSRRFDRPNNNIEPSTPDRIKKPHTSDRRHFRRHSGVSFTKEVSYHNNVQEISTRALSVSPGRTRDRALNSGLSRQDFTTRFASQLPKINAQKKEHDRAATSVSFKEDLTHMRHYQTPMNRELDQITIQTDHNIESNLEDFPKIPIAEELSKAAGMDDPSTATIYQDNLLQTKKIVQAQREKIISYESCMEEKNNEIERLNFEVKLSKKNEAKLELDLEVHDLKYSIYDDFRRLMDIQRLNSKDVGIKLEQPVLGNDDFFSRLDHLEQVYEKSKTEDNSRFSALLEEYKSAILKVSLLEKERLKGRKKLVENIPDADRSSIKELSSDDSSSVLKLLKKRIKVLESDNLKYTLDLQGLRKELQKPKEFSKDKNVSNALLYLEKNALTNKVAALETEIGFTFGQIDKKTRTRRYRTLEKSLNEYIAEIMGLEDRLKAKENIILRLKERDLARRFEVESSTKWYERNDEGEKESTDETSKSVTGEKDHDEVLTDFTKMGQIKMESRKNDIKKGMSSSSARIKLLRIRLNALANDHSSVCTEETRDTHFSEI